MSDWVRGPAPLTERTIDVYEGTVCVILRNGEVYAVRGPGRHGGLFRTLSEDRRLPVLGSLTTLTFERAPAVSRAVTTDVRLEDGSTIQVTVKAAIVPLWQKDPNAVMDVVRRYGVQPARIQEAAQLELEESLRVMATDSLARLTHEQVHATADARSLMRLPRPTGLLTVGHLVSCSITRDRHAEGALAALRDGRLAELREVVESGLAQIRATNQNEVDAIRRHGELTGRMDSAFAEAEMNKVVAKLLGISAVEVAYPAQRDSRLQAQYEAVRAVLEHNMDLLPLLADPAYGNATAGLTGLISGLFPEPANGHRPRSDRPVGSTRAIESGVRLLRKATATGPSGPVEVLLVEGLADRVIGGIGTNGPHRLMVGQVSDPVDISLRALTGAADWCGVRIGARVLNRAASGTPGRVALTGVEQGAKPIHDDVEAALGAWVVAINALLAGAVEISVGS